MTRLLLVEDDPEIRTALLRALSTTGYSVRSCREAMTAVRDVVRWRPEVVILDLGLPDLDGSVALTMIRAVSEVPVIIATARHPESEIVRLLNAGADDYVTKPFSVDHLTARVAAVLRRSGGHPPNTPLTVGGLHVDVAAREATLDNHPLQLSRREFDLLAYLTARPGRVVSRRELFTEIWHLPYGSEEQTIDVHISWLRRKLGETATAPRYLHTVRGVGIKLINPGPDQDPEPDEDADPGA